MIALYSPQQHRSLAFRYGGLDPEMAGRGYAGAWLLWFLGYPEQALTQIHEALALAQGLGHPFILVWALIESAALHQHRREWQLVQEQAEAIMRLASEQGFVHELAGGTGMRGWALAEQGQVEEGIAQMRQSLAARRAMGAKIVDPVFLARLAETYGKVGQGEEGLSLLTEALAVVDSTGQRVYEAEVYRLYGELSLRIGDTETAEEESENRGRGEAETTRRDSLFSSPVPRFSGSPVLSSSARLSVSSPEDAFQKAIEIAQRQQAKSLELRAVMSFSRLWQQQGKKEEARQMLAEIYGWFTEGFDTEDLQEAQELLDQLS